MFPLNKWRHIALGLAIFLIPFDFSFLLFQEEWARGFFNPYLSQHFYLSELMILLAGVLAVFKLKDLKWENHNTNLIALSTTLLLGISAYPNPWLIAKIFIWLLFFLLLTEKESRKHNQNLIRCFIYSMAVQATIAIFQFFFLQNPEILHQAKFQIFSLDFIRSSASFAHANILAAMLSLAIFILPDSKLPKKAQKILLGILMAGLLFSFSRLAIFGLLLAIATQLKSKKQVLLTLSPLALILFLRPLSIQDAALTDRLEGFQISLQLWSESPILGTGFRQSTAFYDALANLRPWDYQPAHNLAILLLTETGVLGLTFAALLAHYAYKNHKQASQALLLFIAITAMGEHYWLTSDQAILGLISVLSFKKEFGNSQSLIGLE